jgi:hypothetical protein
MGEVDPTDRTIKSFLVRHHTFDPETNHFRWFVLKAFDNEAEMNLLLESLWKELQFRRLSGESHCKEHYAGQINDPEWQGANPGWTAYDPLK